MFATRLVQLIESHAEKLSEGAMQKIRESNRCSDLLRKVPEDELKRRSYEVFRNLNSWVVDSTEAEIEERYIALGMRRSRQGVPFSSLFWALTIIKEYLWEHMAAEAFVEQPVDLLGELDLMRHIGQFFDRALYFAFIGYEIAAKDAIEYEFGRSHAAVK